MSVEAINWAFSQPVKHSTAKFVLVAMANCADAELLCWPSIPYLVEKTSQDRKTVQENMRRLRDWGFIEDTGDRKGITKQVIVYRLKTPEKGHVNQSADTPSASTKGTENGHVEEAQKRDSTEKETGPKFPDNRPEIPTEQAQFSLETGPKTGPGTIIEPSGTVKEPKGEEKFDARKFELPEWLPSELWLDWVEYRKGIKAALTKKAAELSIRTLSELRAQGHDPKAVIEQSIFSGKWTGLFEIKKQSQQHQGQPSRAATAREPGLFSVAGKDHSSTKAAAEASRTRHGITVPDDDDDIPL